MRMPERTIGIGLAVGLIGAMTTGVAAQDEGSIMDACTTDAVPVRGEIIWGDVARDPTFIEDGAGTSHIRDFVYLSTMKADDDRLAGDTTGTVDWDFFRLDRKAPQRAGLNQGTFRIDNAEGAWEGPWTGIGSSTDSWRALIELTGSGAYEGFSATLFTHSGDSGPVTGVIYPTDLAACDFAASAG
jgi:hypothetical protein